MSECMYALQAGETKQSKSTSETNDELMPAMEKERQKVRSTARISEVPCQAKEMPRLSPATPARQLLEDQGCLLAKCPAQSLACGRYLIDVC